MISSGGGCSPKCGSTSLAPLISPSESGLKLVVGVRFDLQARSRNAPDVERGEVLGVDCWRISEWRPSPFLG